MKKLLCLALFVFTIKISAQAQLYNKGAITLKNGKTIEGYVQIDYRFPQRWQNGITYISPKAYAKFEKKGKVKGGDKEDLKPKDIRGFELENGSKYTSVKYTDLFSYSKTGIIPRRRVFEQIADGKIKMYKFYSPTTGKKVSRDVMDARLEGDGALIDYIQNNFQLLIQKEGKDKDPKNVMSINMLNYIGDNDEVKTNYDKNLYGLRDQFSTEKKDAKFVDKEYEAAFLRLLADYNK